MAASPSSPTFLYSGLIAPTGAGLSSADILASALDELDALLRDAGGTLADVVSLTSFHTDLWAIEDDLASVADRFGDSPPAWTPVGSTGSEVPGNAVAIRAVAAIGSAKESVLLPEHGWLSHLPISSGCRVGDIVFVAGQLSADTGGHAIGGTDPVAQARVAYGLVGKVVAHFGGTFDDVVNFSHYMVDIRGGDPTFKQVYMPEVLRVVGVERASTTTHVGVPGLLRPGMIGAYEAIVDLTPGQRSGSTPDSVWWKDAYPLAAATSKPGSAYVAVAGHVAATGSGEIAHPGDPAGQLTYVLDGIAETLAGYDLTPDALQELLVFAKDPRFAPELRQIIEARFDVPPPVSILGSTGLWLDGFEIEVAGTALRPQAPRTEEGHN